MTAEHRRSSRRPRLARSRSSSRKVLYELDGGDRTKSKSFKVKVEPGALRVCVPFERGSTADSSMSVQSPRDEAASRQREAPAEVSTSRRASKCLPARASSRAVSSTRSSAFSRQARDRGRRQDHGPEGALHTSRTSASAAHAHSGCRRARRILLWRLLHAAWDTGRKRPTGSSTGWRHSAAGSSTGCCVRRDQRRLAGSGRRSVGNTTKTTAGVFGWPAAARGSSGSPAPSSSGARSTRGTGPQPGLPRGLEDRADEPDDQALVRSG